MTRPSCLVLWVCAVLVGCRESTPEPGSFDRLYLPVDGAFWQISSFDTSGGNRDRLGIAPGASVVLLDVEVADLDGGWAFQMRSADPEGILRWSPESQ